MSRRDRDSPSDDDLELLKLHWLHRDDADRTAAWTAAKEIYGGGKDWESEFAAGVGPKAAAGSKMK